MKTLRLVGKLFGISLLILGFNSSCKKDDDDNGECVTCTIDLTALGGSSYTYTYCENDPTEWEDEYDSWQEVKDYAAYMDSIYEFVDCTF